MREDAVQTRADRPQLVVHRLHRRCLLPFLVVLPELLGLLRAAIRDQGRELERVDFGLVASEASASDGEGTARNEHVTTQEVSSAAGPGESLLLAAAGDDRLYAAQALAREQKPRSMMTMIMMMMMMMLRHRNFPIERLPLPIGVQSWR